MTGHDTYAPSPVTGAQVRKDGGETWTFVLTRELSHSPQKVWDALTDPAQLREWAPFDADQSMAKAGTTVTLTTVGAPAPHVTETKVTRAEALKSLEYKWGGGDVRWELHPAGKGTRLTLWAQIPRNWVAMGAAGWHMSLDVMDHMLAGTPIGRIAGVEAMKVRGWQQLTAEYRKQFGVEAPSWSAKGA